MILFPTCQVRVVRCYVSCPAASSSSASAGPQLQTLDRSVPRRTRTASTLFPAGPRPQALEESGPRRTQTASSGSECCPPDLNREIRIRVFPAGPQPQRISEDVPDRMPERMSEDIPDTYARKNKDRMSENMPERMSTYIYIHLYTYILAIYILPDSMSETMSA